MSEIPKRLAPKDDVLRELFLKSGNLCAYPACDHLIMNAEGVYIAEICHIEAAELRGARFNPNMTNEERRAFENLMLMCHPHHKITDDVVRFPREELWKMKAGHEARFSEPQRAIREAIKDWTTAVQATSVKTLGRMDAVLGWGLSQEERELAISQVNRLISELEITPPDVRNFIGAFVQRAHRLKNRQAVRKLQGRGLAIVAADLESAFQLSSDALERMTHQLEHYGLGGGDVFDFGDQEQWGVYLLDHGDFPFWSDLAEFCDKTAIAVEAILRDLDLSRLDDSG